MPSTPLIARDGPVPTPATAPAVAALLFATTAWGSLFFVGRDVLHHLDPLWFTTVRYTLATAVLVALLARFGQAPWACVRREGGRLMSFGFAGYGVFSLFVFFGIAHSVPSHGAVIMATMPFTTLLMRWALDGQRPAARSLAAAGVALAGVAGVAGLVGGGSAVSTPALVGDAVTLVGTLGWVAYTRGAASLPRLAPLEYTAFTAVAALPLLLATAIGASLAHVVPWPAWTELAAMAPRLAYVAVVPTVAAAIAFNFGVRRLGAAAGTLFINFVPISALAIGTALGQPPRLHEIVGAGLVVLALLVSAPRRAPAPAPAGA